METAEAILAELRSLGQRRRAVLLEAGLMAFSGGGLVLGAAGLGAAPIDLRFLFLAATGLFSLAAIHWVDELLSILQAECPRCARLFFAGAPDRWPSPLRRRCGHCGLPLAGSPGRRG